MTHPNNALYQARWRARRQAELEMLRKNDDFNLYVRAAEPLMAALEAEGRKSAVTTIPAEVRMTTCALRRLNEAWPHLSTDAKGRLANAGSRNQIVGIIREELGAPQPLRKKKVRAA
jgi:hypothetical protein